MADQIVITEKSSQAKDVRAAVGSRYGDILPAEGHLFDLLEPEDVVPAWKRWSPILLRPERSLRHPPSGGRQQSRQAQSHSRGITHRQAGGSPPTATARVSSSVRKFSSIMSTAVR